MKPRNAFLLALAFCFSTLAFAGDADYTVKAPDGWKKRTTSSAPEHYMKKGVSLMLTIDYAPADAKTLDAYVELAKKQYTGVIKNVKFDPVKKMSINGLDARELTYTGETAGLKMKYDVAFVMKGTKVYTMTAGGMADTFDAMKAEYLAFFNSFRLK